ncbi:hypothetical protein NKDENANG_01787 [Candidatus Entotheonellaceae bacterium PAL068K]
MVRIVAEPWRPLYMEESRGKGMQFSGGSRPQEIIMGNVPLSWERAGVRGKECGIYTSSPTPHSAIRILLTNRGESI